MSEAGFRGSVIMRSCPLTTIKQRSGITWCEACCHKACVDMTMARFTSRASCPVCPSPPRTLWCVNSFHEFTTESWRMTCCWERLLHWTNRKHLNRGHCVKYQERWKEPSCFLIGIKVINIVYHHYQHHQHCENHILLATLDTNLILILHSALHVSLGTIRLFTTTSMIPASMWEIASTREG